MAVQDEKETMDDGGNGNELQQLLLKQKKELQQLQRIFKEQWCLTLFQHRVARRMLGGLTQPIKNDIFEGGKTMQAWSGSFQAMINAVSAEAMLVFLFQPMKNKHRSINILQQQIEVVENDEEFERSITMFDTICECNGLDEAMRMLEAFEVLAPTFNINTALSLATIHYKQGTIQVDGIYYLLKQQQRMLHKYRTLFDAAVLGNTTTNNTNDDDSFEIRLATIFTFQMDDEENKTISDAAEAAAAAKAKAAAVAVAKAKAAAKAAAASPLGSARPCRSVVAAAVAVAKTAVAAATTTTTTTTTATTTLFQKACTGLGRKTGLELLEETLGRSSQSVNTRRGLVYAGTTNNEHRSANNNKEIHLDYIFLLLRREPDVLLSSNRKSSSSSSALLMPPSLEGSSSSSNNISSNSTNTDNDCRQHYSWKRQKTA